MIIIRDAIPNDWATTLGDGPIALGHDVATTTKKKSNWSSLTVTEHTPGLYVERLVVRWKTDSGDASTEIIDTIVSDIEAAGRRARVLNVDGSSEKLYAKRLQKHFMGRVPIRIIVSGQKVEWHGESYDYKTLTGDLYIAAFEDNLIAIPAEQWLKKSLRLVSKENGRYVAEIADDGDHGDEFDSGKLAYWGLMRKAHFAPGSITVAPTSTTFGDRATSSRSLNPFAKLFNNAPRFRG